MTRDTTIPAPFTGGRNTDRSYFQLSLQETVDGQDFIAPNGIATQRKGWVYDGTTAEHGANVLEGIARNAFVLSAVTRTITTDTTTAPVMIHNPSSAGTALVSGFPGGTVYIPRCIYRDELIICAQDGLHPLLRYSGSGATSTSAVAGNANYTSGKAVVALSAGAFNANTGPGSYIAPNVSGAVGVTSPVPWLRVLERNSSASMTLEGIRAGSAIAGFDAITESPYGFAWPAVAVYNAGTASVAANTATGTGTKWFAAAASGVSIEFGREGFLVIPVAAGGTAIQSDISQISSDTSLNTTTLNITDTTYAICRRLPFKDAAAHRGSLWGTGVAQFPDRVYCSPPGWNLSLPPGFTEPLNPMANASSLNANDFLLSYVDVPSPYDGDAVVAILTSSGPLLVLKRYSVYGVYGSYPNFQVSLIPGGQGAGCIDVRSAISVPEGQFWASDLGVFTYRNGQIIELTRGRISREWRTQYRAGGGFARAGVVANHLIVWAGANAFIYDLVHDVWITTFTNWSFSHYWRSKVSSEQDRLMAVVSTRVADVAPAFDVTNASGAPKDANNLGPRMQATTGPALAQAAGIDGEAKLLDVVVDANIYDSATPSTSMTVSVTHSGGMESSAQRTKTLGTITGDTANLARRTLFRDVNRGGRLHSLSIDVSTTDTDNQTVAIPEIVMTWRDTRSGT